MVDMQRLISTMIVTTCAVTLLNLNSSTMGQEDIGQNLIHDPVELGNPYQSSQDIRSASDNQMKKVKHPSNHRRPTPSSSDSPHFLSSGQEVSSVLRSENSTVITTAESTRRQNASGIEEGHQPAAHAHHHRNSLGESENAHDSGNCPLCAAARRNAGLDDETLRAVRVEIVKQQILKKLRLKEPPKMDNVPKGHHTILPPIALGNSMTNAVKTEEDEEDMGNLDLEDFYGKTEQIIVLPQDELADCARWPSTNTNSNRARSEAASCFVYNLPKEVRSNQIQISSAELWVYKLSDVSATTDQEDSSLLQPNKTLPIQHHFSISEIASTSNYRSSRRRNSLHYTNIASRSDVPETSAWISFNITDRARKWLVTEAHDHTIKISCSTCSRDVHEFPFHTAGEQQPFIVFNIANGKTKRRNKRSINCSPGVTECCRESLRISFREIKWNWVLEPDEFDAYYCKGSCHGDTALAHTATRHSGIMIDYVKSKGGVSNKTLELVPCCTATEMGHISLLYRDPQSYNTTLQHVRLPNMVVKSCGCK